MSMGGSSSGDENVGESMSHGWYVSDAGVNMSFGSMDGVMMKDIDLEDEENPPKMDTNVEKPPQHPNSALTSTSTSPSSNETSIPQMATSNHTAKDIENEAEEDVNDQKTELLKAKEDQKKQLLENLLKYRLSIPASLLELAPSPDVIEAFGKFYTAGIEMVVEYGISPHPSLIGEWRILRFLSGHAFNLPHALQAFEKHLFWLKTVYGDTVIRQWVLAEMLPTLAPENAPLHEKISSYFPINILLKDEEGNLLLDKNGNILSIERPGFIDNKRFSVSVSDDELFLWYNYQLEFRSLLLDQLSRERKKLIRATQIIDLSGLSSRSVVRVTSHLWKKSILLAIENYPEMLSHVFFVNAPKVFNTIWAMFSPLLSERTNSKIHILNENFEDFLHTYIDKESLPTFLGGTRNNRSATVPLTGLLSNDRFSLGLGRAELNISPRRKEQLSYRVAPGMTVHWTWALEDHEIYFCIKMSRHRSTQLFGKSEEEFVLAQKSYDCTKTYRGSVYSPHDAYVIFTWDNSWGLFSSRHIHYRIVVTSPEDEAVIT